LFDKDETFIIKLHKLLDNNSSGIETAKIFEAMEDDNRIKKSGRYVNAAIKYFNLRCSNQSITSCLNKGRFTKAEKKQIID